MDLGLLIRRLSNQRVKLVTANYNVVASSIYSIWLINMNLKGTVVAECWHYPGICLGGGGTEEGHEKSLISILMWGYVIKPSIIVKTVKCGR